MINTWVETSIGTLLDKGAISIQTGPFGSQLHSYDYEPVGIPVVLTEAIGRRRLITDGAPRVSPATADRLSRHKLRPGDILFARRGAQATGLSAIVEKEHSGWLCGSGAILLRVNDPSIDPTYLSFVLSADTTIEWLKQHAVGAVMPNLNETVIRGLRIPLPTWIEQCAIAEVLGSLEDKIELNRRMNITLKFIAQAIFRHWFVDDAENRRTGIIRDLISEITERNSSNANIQVFSAVKSGELLASDEVFTKRVYSLDSSKYKIIRKHDFAYNPARVNIGSIGMLEHDKGLVSPVYTAFSVKTGFEWYLLFFIRLPQTKAFIEQLCSGSVRQNLTFDNFASIDIPIPSESRLQEFNEQWLNLRNLIKHNEKESDTLASLRDSLLPKLMRGEVRVKVEI